ncbi:MAG TPA: winged helix-turn-helix domain-containing protein [Steroidobacteraceae bacterium]|jgi:TolB-like protein
MDQPSGTSLRIGDWRVSPASGQISREGETVRVEARTMRLLLCLAEHAGQVVSSDELLEQVWSGVIVTQDSVHQAITSLRRLFLVYGRIGGTARSAATPDAARVQFSVAVLPVLDLTSESMDQEYFADGMTEELIDRLSKIPGLRVPPPTSSFSHRRPLDPRRQWVRGLVGKQGAAAIIGGN